MTPEGWAIAGSVWIGALAGCCWVRWALARPVSAAGREVGAAWIAEVSRVFGTAPPGASTLPVIAIGLLVLVSLFAVRFPLVLLVVGVALGSVPWTRVRAVRRGPSRGDGLIAAIEDIASRLAGGASLLRSLSMLPPDAQHGAAAGLGEVGRQVQSGAPMQTTLDRWATRSGDADASLLADALALAGVTGASQAAALVRVAATVRERTLLRGEVQAQAAQARASAAVLVVAPIVFAVAMAIADDAVRHVLLSTPVGWACMLAGASLDLLGGWWMRKMIGAVG